MRSAHILLLCVLGAALLSSVICNSLIGPDDCCFDLYPRRLNKNLIRSYRLTDHRCMRAGGVILTTKKGRKICADRDLPWVVGIMKHLDEEP